jgi:LPS O-antigen subunit length determinant protein (WzzB/FepE family)
MKNSNLNNEYLDDEIDLIEFLKTLFNSKKLIVIVTLAFSLLAFIYTTQKDLEYKSTVILEVGSYSLLSGEKKLVEPVSSLIKKLKVNLLFKRQLEINDSALNFKAIEGQLLEIDYTSPSFESNENAIKEAIIFAQENHTEIRANIVNSFSEEIADIDNEIEFLKNSMENQQASQKLKTTNKIKIIDAEIEFLKNSIENQQASQKLKTTNKIKIIDAEIEFLKNSIENQQASQKLNAINAIKIIDLEIPSLENKIKYLLKLIPEEENNLLLLQSNSSALLQRTSSSPTLQQIIYSYNEQNINLKNQIQNLKLEKETLELQVASIAEGDFISEQLFKLNQEKETLELQVASIAEGDFISEQLFKLNQEKDTIELQVASIAEGDFIPAQLFKLNQEKDALELQVKLVNDLTNSTKPIRELITKEIKPRPLLTILIGTIFGFIFSISILLIRQAFLKEQN